MPPKFNMKMAGKLFKWLVPAQKGAIGTGGLRNILHLLVIGAMLLSFITHPYYVSVTEVEYKPGTGEIEIACKIFTDDLELALRQSFQEQVDLYNQGQKTKNERLLQQYFEKHLGVTGNNKPLKFSLLGSEIQEEACWSYLLIKNVPKLKSLTVFNDLLYHSRKDQINIIHFRVKEHRQSHRLAYPDHTYTYRWD